MIKTIQYIVNDIKQTKEQVMIAIDGRCASGKTTLATELQEMFSCNVFHMDDFFLRPEQRTEARYAEPGGNVDYERFLVEVLQPLKSGKPFQYQPFDCCTMTLKQPVYVKPKPIAIIEGTYSCHPTLWQYYDLHIFLNITSDKQLERLKIRNPKNVDAFIKRWIPLEEHYFTKLNIEKQCDLKVDSY